MFNSGLQKPMLCAICLLLLFHCGNLAAQSPGAPKYGNIWYFGQGRGLDFNTTPPTPLYDGLGYGNEGLTTIADPNTGEYLLFFDGDLLFRRGDTRFEDGRQLLGRRTASQGTVILPLPGSNRYYYIFYVDDLTGIPVGPRAGLFYIVVDVDATGSEPFIVQAETSLEAKASEKLAAVYNCEKNSYWIATNHRSGDELFLWELKEDGLQEKIVQSNLGLNVRNDISFALGSIEFSPDASKMAISGPAYLGQNFELFNFNLETGEVSDPAGFVDMPLDRIENGYAMSFSPDGSKLYINNFNSDIQLIQFDLSLANSSDIFDQRSVIEMRNPDGQSNEMCGIQLAPDGKIYVAGSFSEDNTGWLGVINNPNAPGAECDYQRKGIAFENTAKLELCSGLPNHVDTWFSSKPSSLCLGPDARVLLSDTVICLGGGLEVNDGSVNLPSQWSWTITDPNGGTRTFNVRDPGTVTFDIPGDHVIRLVVSNRWGASEITRTVSVLASSAEINAGEDIEICPGESATLNAESSGGMVTWTPNDEYIDDVNSDTPTVNPPTSRWYHLEVVSPEGCVARDSVFVQVTPGPTVEIVADRLVVCPGEAVQLRVLMAEVDRFNWENPEDFDDPMSPAPTVRPTRTSRYTITVWRGTCRVQASIEIAVNNVLEISIDTPAVVCPGEEVELHAEVPDGATLEWTPANLFNNPGTANPRLRPTASRWVYLYAEHNGCTAFDSTFVEVFPAPQLNIDVPPAMVCRGTEIQLNATADQPGTIIWTPAAGLDDATSFTPRLTLTENRRLTATFTGAEGCTSSEEILLDIAAPTRTDIEVTIDETNVLPGDRITWRLTQAGDTGLINSINIDLAFTQQAARVIEESILAAPGWTFTLTPNVSGGLLNIQGEGPPTETAELLQWQTYVLLVELNNDGIIVVEPLDMTLTSVSNCFTAGEATSDYLMFSPYCLGNSRLLTIGAGAFALHAPQPNPTGPGAAVRFELGFNSHALLQVFNALGELAAKPIDAHLAAGEHEIQLPSNLAGGLYLLRLQAGPYIGTQTVIVSE